MSISGALSNALSGLTASSRASELVSSNVANAATEGYGRRELNLSARSVGGAGAGVQVDGVTRVVDETILSDRRLADAGLGYASTLADFYSELEEMVGTPGDPGSLSNRIAQFEAALIDAASRPDASVKLGAALGAATGLTGTLNDISDGLQTMRQTADREIAGQVAALNRALVDIDDMNEEIVRLGRRQGDMSALFDQRQKLIDEIAAIVPLREIPRDNGSIALYTQGGAPLLEVEPVQFGFVQANFVTADMTLASGALSGLTINGNSVLTLGQYSPIGGGSLAALFAVRDQDAVAAQSDIDAVARDLMERFEDPAADATLTAGDPGLFTDRGAPFDPLTEIGLAGRIEVNALVDPDRGGGLWRLRDGLGAAAPGDAGVSTGLNALANALTALRPPASGSFGTGARSADALGGDFLSRISAARLTSQADQGFATAKYDSLRSYELSQGVDTDQEMQKLLLIEQSYAANAQVIQSVDRLIQLLLEI